MIQEFAIGLSDSEMYVYENNVDKILKFIKKNTTTIKIPEFNKYIKRHIYDNEWWEIWEMIDTEDPMMLPSMITTNKEKYLNRAIQLTIPLCCLNKKQDLIGFKILHFKITRLKKTNK